MRELSEANKHFALEPGLSESVQVTGTDDWSKLPSGHTFLCVFNEGAGTAWACETREDVSELLAKPGDKAWFKLPLPQDDAFPEENAHPSRGDDFYGDLSPA